MPSGFADVTPSLFLLQCEGWRLLTLNATGQDLIRLEHDDALALGEVYDPLPGLQQIHTRIMHAVHSF